MDMSTIEAVKPKRPMDREKTLVPTLLKVLRSNADIATPEQKLWFSVFEHALKDYFLRPSSDPLKSDAEEWLHSSDAEAVMNAVGLHPAWVRRKIVLI